MFSSLTHRLGLRFLDRLDLLVELSTLGGYRVDCEGVYALEPDVAVDPYGEGIIAVGSASYDVTPASAAPPVFARSRGDCPHGARLSPFCRDAAVRP